MALKATVVRAELQISDMDRHYYATHPLTLAQHPSETDERLVVRLLAFALYADERLEFGRGLSTDEDPDLWQRDYTGEIERWIDLGQAAAPPTCGGRRTRARWPATTTWWCSTCRTTRSRRWPPGTRAGCAGR